MYALQLKATQDGFKLEDVQAEANTFCKMHELCESKRGNHKKKRKQKKGNTKKRRKGEEKGTDEL
ncbi:hypothetical protein N9L31_00265 [bacterium]|nr:hypothetical protein [bacterium]